MKFEHYLKRVEESSEFKKFTEKHKSSFLTAGFFVLDLEAGKHMHQIDYFIPGSKKIATFAVDDKIKMKMSEGKFKGKTPLKIEGSTKIDLEALQGIVHDEMLNRTVTQQIKKIIAVLINEDGKKVWKLNCITGDMGIIKVNVDDASSSVLEFEKASLFDMVKFMPKQPMAAGGLVPQPEAPQPQTVQIQPQQVKVENSGKQEKTEDTSKKKESSNITARKGKK